MIRPLNDNVVLKKEKIVRETASGIVLSQKEEEPEYATVVAVSEGKRNEKGEIIQSLEEYDLQHSEQFLHIKYWFLENVSWIY